MDQEQTTYRYKDRMSTLEMNTRWISPNASRIENRLNRKAATLRFRSATRSACAATPMPKHSENRLNALNSAGLRQQIDPTIHLARMCVEIIDVFEEGNTEEVQQIHKKHSRKRDSADYVEDSHNAPMGQRGSNVSPVARASMADTMFA